ncbi:hypothetical protein HBN50_07980 [Halobacteriovorax sp. GB3]|uniref:hypothetical protein n=1 Tax=Halobacteriovorax sp. GB3 TaxID=2719615 RepID=UPI0023615FD4|nr:hypothetical protein [Halobacteriovorax sp. GB3]MDD0853031.1 hypothetical protein [Halobacteriovorax sp. GB3]
MRKAIAYNWMYLKKIKLSPRGVYVFFLVLKDSLKWCFTINIGNFLKHEGKIVYVNNGTNPTNWSCLEVNKSFQIIYPDGKSAISIMVPKSNARKVYQLSTPIQDFMRGFRFYMGYWYEIWVFGTIKYGDRSLKRTKKK